MFSASKHPVPSYWLMPPSLELLREKLQMTSAWQPVLGGQAQGFEISKTWGTGVPAVQQDSMLQTLIP